VNIIVMIYGSILEQQVYKSKKKEIKISNNEIVVSLKENASLLELLKILGISEQGGLMHLINGKVSHFDNKLCEGDKIEIFLLVDGG